MYINTTTTGSEPNRRRQRSLANGAMCRQATSTQSYTPKTMPPRLCHQGYTTKGDTTKATPPKRESVEFKQAPRLPSLHTVPHALVYSRALARRVVVHLTPMHSPHSLPQVHHGRWEQGSGHAAAVSHRAPPTDDLLYLLRNRIAQDSQLHLSPLFSSDTAGTLSDWW